MPRRPQFQGITLTGADESTPLTTLQRLLAPGCVELAFLLSLDATGPRFVGSAWLRQTLPRLQGPLALHLCGPAARRLLREGGLDDLMAHLARVQVNGPVAVEELPLLAARVPLLITQHDAANAALATRPLARHALLVDDSGGHGVLPAGWLRPVTHKPVGFAGGLRLDNLAAQLDAIAAVADGDWWIDLETGLRDTSDRFDPALAERIVQRVHALGLRPGTSGPGFS